MDDPPDDPNSESDPLTIAIATLGEPISVHRLSDRRQRTLTLGGLGLVLGGIITLSLWMWLIPNIAAAVAWKLLLTPVIFGFVLLGQVIRTRGLVVYVFPTGVLRTGRGSVESFLWDEIESLTMRADAAKLRGERDASGQWTAVWFDVVVKLFRTGSNWIELQRSDGVKLKLSPVLDDYAGLSKTIQQITFAERWPKTVQALADGQRVSFGPFFLHHDQLESRKGKMYRFAFWKNARLQGRFLLFGKKQFLSIGGAIDIVTIPYPHVLLAALHDRVGGLIDVVQPELTTFDDQTAAGNDLAGKACANE